MLDIPGGHCILLYEHTERKKKKELILKAPIPHGFRFCFILILTHLISSAQRYLELVATHLHHIEGIFLATVMGFKRLKKLKYETSRDDDDSQDSDFILFKYTNEEELVIYNRHDIDSIPFQIQQLSFFGNCPIS